MHVGHCLTVFYIPGDARPIDEWSGDMLPLGNACITVLVVCTGREVHFLMVSGCLCWASLLWYKTFSNPS